jgi:hypothetical protein
MTDECTQIELAQVWASTRRRWSPRSTSSRPPASRKRRPAADDRRARIVAVTKRGERKVAKAEEIVDGQGLGCLCLAMRDQSSPHSNRPGGTAGYAAADEEGEVVAARWHPPLGA